MADTFVEMPAEPASNRLQLLAAVLLGIAATLTALSAYKAALLDGDALQGYSQSSRSLSDANAFYAQSNQTFALDNQLFVQYATASQEGNTQLGEYLTTLMRPELVAAVEWWIETDDAVTPFDALEGNPYELADADTARALEAQAQDEFEDGADADEQGDLFELATVLLALTLFFGGIATLFSRRSASLLLLSVGGVTLVAGTIQLIVGFAG